MNVGRAAGPRDARGLELASLAAEVREMDRRTIEEVGIPGRVLMELAGAGAARLVLERTGGRPGRAVVLTGGGHNGGDGYVVARHLRDHGWSVLCVATRDPEELGGDARDNALLWSRHGGEVRVVGAKIPARVANRLGHADVVVDALFGTGLSRPLEGVARALVELANSKDHGLKVAVDVPSGVDADRGVVLGAAFRADLTATFGIVKVGLFLHPGAAFAGEVAVVPIAIPRAVVDAVGASWRVADAGAVAGLLPPRPPGGHKGSFGHVGIVGGRAGKEGAAILAGLGALHGGAGLVTWNWNHESAPAAVERPPELMTFDARAGLDPRATVLVVGPGLGQDAGSERALDLALEAARGGRGLVVDADASNLLARGGRSLPAGAILTPHPAEAARLLGTSAAEVQADRLRAASELSRRFDAVVVLKGAGTVVAGAGRSVSGGAGVVVPIAEPALAAGGTGDVLAGLAGALLAQGAPAFDAAVAAAWVHAEAGLRAGRDLSHAGLLARDLAPRCAAVLADLRAGWLSG